MDNKIMYVKKEINRIFEVVCILVDDEFITYKSEVFKKNINQIDSSAHSPNLDITAKENKEILEETKEAVSKKYGKNIKFTYLSNVEFHEKINEINQKEGN